LIFPVDIPKYVLPVGEFPVNIVDIAKYFLLVGKMLLLFDSG